MDAIHTKRIVLVTRSGRNIPGKETMKEEKNSIKLRLIQVESTISEFG